MRTFSPEDNDSSSYLALVVRFVIWALKENCS